jgi:DNA-binding transcriptional MerR regulator
MGWPELTLEELSRRTGIEPRTLRSWVSEGLLSPPFRPGRGATYPASNVDRALAIRALKDVHGLTLSEIGRRFLMASDEQIRDWAASAGPTTAPPGSARAYLRALREREAGAGWPGAAAGLAMSGVPPRGIKPGHADAGPREKPMGFLAPVVADRARIEQLIFALEALLRAPAPRRATSTVWTRIGITADLELSVRGDLDPAERHLFEQLANQLRAILTGSSRP